MNFTREPIIETIISPKEGCKLLVRNSKGENFEEHYVDAVEVVSFGRAFFFRSLERPKAFLVPVSDYEVLEIKEARVALKNASHEKNIKIGGGREAHMRPSQREPKEAPAEEPSPQLVSEEPSVLETAVDSRMDRKRDRRRHRRRRGGRDDRDQEHKPHHEPHEKETEEEKLPEEESKGGPSLFSTLIPPPPTLISETLSRYREKELLETKEEQEKPDTDEQSYEPDEDKDEGEQGTDEQGTDESDTGSSPLHRISAPTQESTSFNATYFIPLPGGNDPYF